MKFKLRLDPERSAVDRRTKQEQNDGTSEGVRTMSSFFRDAAALIAVVSFVAAMAVWSEALQAVHAIV